MEPKFYLVLMLFAVLCHSCLSQQCKKLSEANTLNVICDCDGLDEKRGWEYTCFQNGTLSILFILRYITDSAISFDCSENNLHYEPLFHVLNYTNIHTFEFKSCPLPNVSYGDMIPDYERTKLEEIRIENTKDNRSFTAEIFEPTSQNLKVLVLINNGIRELPGSIFNNFPKLEYLSLSDNLLKTCPEKIFRNLQQLSILEIANNRLEYLPENLFQSLFQLKKLYIYKNKLKELPNKIFKSLPSLEVLDLADNQLLSMPRDIFLGLSQLKHIRLRGNWLRTLPKELFSYSLNLQEIDLSINKFMEPLPEVLLRGLVRLEKFKVEECNISSIHESFFGFSPNLTHLQLQYNRLKELPENIFHNNILLKQIDLSFNFIETLHENLLFNQKNLEKLSLYHNNISLVPNEFFKNARNIKTLLLGQNKLQNITQAVFRDLPNVETVSLSKNNLTYFKLDLNREIKQLDLSYNNLTSMPDIEWLNHLKLEIVQLQYNQITSFSLPFLYSTNKINPTVDVSHNNIKTVDVDYVVRNDDSIKDLSSEHYERYVETTISLKENPFTCDCRLYGFVRYLNASSHDARRSVRFAMIQDLICYNPPSLRNKPLLQVKASDFRCDLKENCSTPCHCYIRAQDMSKIANCSNHDLKKLPQLVPHNTSILYFQQNSFNDMAEFHDAQWSNLTEMYLDNNEINDLNDWKIPSKLKVLSLSGNRIRTLPEVFMNITAGQKNFYMNLSRNPWTCDCSTMKFKKWLAEHYQIIHDANKLQCSIRQKQNSTLAGVSVLTIPDDEMCPPDDWPYRVQVITVATVCAILALSLFVVSVLYYRNKQTVIAYLYIHMHPFFICFFNEEDFDEDKIFDAFVAYGHDDCDVAHKLIEELEPNFQLCIHERNWIAGNQISWNIFNSVHNSRRTILVISKQFLESMWFQVEFHTAYFQMLEDKIDRLIIIVKGELPPKETLDKELLYLLSTKTYLIWEERWFWEKLRYAMPHKKQQALQSNVLALKDKPDREKIKTVDNQIAILSANSNKATDKVQEVMQNGTNRALSLVNKDTSNKR